MVNYCCVNGCGRNSRQHRLLKFYSLPKEKHRQFEWLQAAGRQDLIEGLNTGTRPPVYRFCSKHFEESTFKANRFLVNDAVPTLFLNGEHTDTEDNDEPEHHYSVICDSCKNPIEGFRYKCIECPEFDLCQRCEGFRHHSHHHMLRIVKPMTTEVANILKTLRDCFSKTKNVSIKTDSCSDSSDDEPITKYVSRRESDNVWDDSGIELDDEVKNKIKAAVKDCLEKTNKLNLNKKSKVKKRSAVGTRSSKKAKLDIDDDVREIKHDVETLPALDDDDDEERSAPEVVFADVNALQHGDVKTEFVNEGDLPVMQVSDEQPTMQLICSDGFGDLMMEISRNT